MPPHAAHTAAHAATHAATHAAHAAELTGGSLGDDARWQDNSNFARSAILERDRDAAVTQSLGLDADETVTHGIEQIDGGNVLIVDSGLLVGLGGRFNGCNRCLGDRRRRLIIGVVGNSIR